jgi:hypothetical protein
MRCPENNFWYGTKIVDQICILNLLSNTWLNCWGKEEGDCHRYEENKNPEMKACGLLWAYLTDLGGYWLGRRTETRGL